MGCRPGTMLGAAAGHRTAAQLYHATKQAWCESCKQRVSADPASNCRVHGTCVSHAAAWATIMEAAVGAQPTMHAYAAAAAGGIAAAGGGSGGQASGAPVSPIPAGSRSAPERARHAAELMRLLVVEHCNLLGLGVNPNLVRRAFALLLKP